MARKKVSKAKEPIKIWQRKLRNGNIALVLRRYIPGSNGKGYETESLGLYLVPERDAAAKAQNKNTLLAANAIRAQRLLDFTNGKAGIKKVSRSKKTLLVDWMEAYRDKKAKFGQSKSNAVTINNVLMHLVKYKGSKITMDKVNKDYCLGFILYLNNAKTIGTTNPLMGHHNERTMAKSTAKLYYNTFVTALNEAVRDGIIETNPTAKIKKEEKKPINISCNTRPYLTIEELNAMIATPYKEVGIRNAFLFSCFCGLRYSDVVDLKWSDIKNDGKSVSIQKIQVKTKQTVIIPLSKEALLYMPDRKDLLHDGFVFNLPPSYTVNYHIKKWAKLAHVDKDISFHVSRHTFATTLITLGADLYTTSKLMGHQNLRTTQIYAEIVNKKRVEAVSLLDNMFNNKNK